MCRTAFHCHCAATSAATSAGTSATWKRASTLDVSAAGSERHRTARGTRNSAAGSEKGPPLDSRPRSTGGRRLRKRGRPLVMPRPSAATQVPSSREMAKSRLHGWLKLEEEPSLTAPCDDVPSTQRSTESHRPIYISKTGVTWLGKPCPRPHDQMMHDMRREAGMYAKRSNSFARWSTPRVVRQLGEYTTDAVGASMDNWDMLQGAAADGTPSDVRRALDAHDVVFRAKGQGPRAWIDSTDDNGRTALMLAVIREIACHKVAAPQSSHRVSLAIQAAKAARAAVNRLAAHRGRAVRAAPSRRALIGVCDAQARTALGERRHCSSCTGARACTCTTPTDRRRSPTPACSACTTW